MGESDGRSDAHWAFALAVYGQPGVPDACITLQDRHGVDVNVMLVMLFANAVHGTAPRRDAIVRLDAVGRPIQETVVKPLREVRRAMKGRDFGAATEHVRGKVKASELAAEQLEQAAMAEVICAWPKQDGPCTPETVVAVVTDYFSGSVHRLDDALVAPIARAVYACRNG